MPLSLHEQWSSINYDGMFPLINKARVTHKIQICHSQHSDSMRTVLILWTNYIMLSMLFGKLKDKEIKMLCLSPAKKRIDMESPILIPWCPSEIYLSVPTHPKQQGVFVKTCSKSNCLHFVLPCRQQWFNSNPVMDDSVSWVRLFSPLCVSCDSYCRCQPGRHKSSDWSRSETELCTTRTPATPSGCDRFAPTPVTRRRDRTTNFKG